MFSSKSFRVYGLTFRFLIHFEFIFVYGVIFVYRLPSLLRWERVCLNIGSMVVYLDLFLDDSALIYRQ